MGEKGAQWLVTLARLGYTSATSVPLFSHPERYLVTFLVHFHIALGERFGPFFRYFWDLLGFSGGPPRFMPILGQFWPFLTTFGPFLDHFWTEKKNWLFLMKNGILAQK